MTPTDMQGKICLVTGSTRGLGKSTALALAHQHATVILGCRDKQRGEAVLAEIKFSALYAFGASKACNLLFTYELAHRLAGTTVTDNAFYPGLVKTALMRDAPVPLQWLNPLFGKSPELVAQSVVYYASSPEVRAMTGLFFNKGRQSINSSSYT